MAPPGESVQRLAAAAIEIWRRAGTGDVETMRDDRLQTIELSHHRLPLAPVRPGVQPFLQMEDQPVRHLVGYDLVHESLPVFVQQRPIETQPATLVMRLSGASATQIEPDFGPG